MMSRFLSNHSPKSSPHRSHPERANTKVFLRRFVRHPSYCVDQGQSIRVADHDCTQMYGRRRHPLLGAAVVVGTSRSVARHEVAQQTQAQAQRDQDIRYAEDQKRREQEETSRRTQLAIDESLAKERERVAMSSRQPAGPPSYVAEPGPRSTKAENVRYCGACGSMCKFEDRFCPGCGAQQVQQQQSAPVVLI